ncbi:amidohydrolase family protein [Roseomonas stagni]|uniref:Amidohydrolase family protein n=1 Tax=Falsiroseomonas algicola TaxID=2716930 RepID=A0A6M1LPV5_9PROT|nr:amidohydrolase family protein [Falsiroseomonas algicola]NGM22207.1 amidohydrolase family protein [Falsiroseomonas algicola]
MALLLTHAAILTMDAAHRILRGHDIRIENGVIAAIGPDLSVVPGDEVIDCRHALVTPGLVNVHTHAATALFRGLAEDLPRDFWAGAYRVPGQERFTEADYALSLRAACAEFLLNGVTCIADRLAGMDRLAPVIEASGLRAVVGSTLTDARAAEAWAETDRLLARYGTDPARSRITTAIAPHALDSCSDALLAEVARRAEREGARVVLHVAQSAPEVAAVRARGHAGALACLRRAGLANARTVAAHAIYLEESEIEGWCEDGIAIAHCPASNLKIEARTIPLHRYVGRVPVGLGTDWTASDNAMDMIWEARLAALVGKQSAGDPTALPVATMLRMMTVDGARVLGLDPLIGSVEVGKRADLVTWNLDRLEMAPAHDLGANLLYSASPRSVRDVMVDGTVLVREGRLVREEEAALVAAMRRAGWGGLPA